MKAQHILADSGAGSLDDRVRSSWRPLSEAKPDGTVCELLFNDIIDNFDEDAHRYFHRISVAFPNALATGIRQNHAGTPALSQKAG